jgi:hypothetical protein
MAATYSRGVYKTTTIGKAAFDGRVRNGNGSDHCGIVTKKTFKEHAALARGTDTRFGHSLKTTHRKHWNHNSRVKFAILHKEEITIKPHDRLVLVN